MRFRKSILIGIMAMAAALPAFGMIIEIPLDRMISEAELIVKGRVLDMQSRWSDGPTNIIVTDVAFAVDEVLMGSDLEGVIELQVVGGEVGEIGMRVEHQPRFAIQEEAVIFLEMSPDKSRWFRILNDEQGKYSVVGSTVFNFKRDALPMNEFREAIELSKQRHRR